MPAAKNAVVLLSGGLDSATCLAIARSEGFVPHALSFSYGQLQTVELTAAARVAEALGAASHRILEIDLRGGSALTGEGEIPKNRVEIGDQIPATYVPARNTVLLSHALGWSEILGAFDIFIGVNAVDYSGYPDCRPEFIFAFERLANLATAAAVEGKGHFKIHAPLLDLTKAEIIRRGTELGIDYGITHSCYDPVGELACGACDACTLRRHGFSEAGLPDPTAYQPSAHNGVVP